ncbi:sugar ABC transporter ATP-binding protein [Arsenicitalea aurantiaca]|nr:sugar ABC transporter ATP-binding protein [Arsenicitalea aurantiaca]
MDQTGTPMLSARGLTKRFAANVVLDGVDFDLLPGEVHAIVGENGAGKSTFIKLLSGIYQPDGGEMRLEGAPASFRGPQDSMGRGVIVIHQELSLAPHLSVEENIFLGHFPRRFGVIDRRHMREEATRLLQRLLVDIPPATRAGDLSIAQQQMVEIAKALSHDARVLILDEPTAVLDSDRAELLFKVMETLKAEGIGIVFISHHLEEIFRIADRVTVLRDGKVTGTADVADVDQEWLVRHMVGRGFSFERVAQDLSDRETVLVCEGLASPGRFADVSFTLARGEILGIAGLVGAGRSEIARALVGTLPVSSGKVTLEGRAARFSNPRAAARAGLYYLTEDRKAEGILPNRPVRENATIANLKAFLRNGLLSRRAENRFIADYTRQLDIRMAGPGVEIRNLSGGNQQKVLLARALSVRPKVLVLDEPTRGVDIGAKQEIYSFIRQLVDEGMSILLISSEMEEILRLSDRILVMRQGRIAATLQHSEADEASIMRAAALG